MGILVLAMATIGMQINKSVEAVIHSDNDLQATLLAESKLAEFDTGLMEREREQEGDFGRAFPEYGWRMTIEPTAVEELDLMTIQIYHEQLEDETDEINLDDACIRAVLRTFRASPATVNFERDFGFTTEQTTGLLDTLADGANTAEITMPDLPIGGSFELNDLRNALAAMPPESRLQILLQLGSMFGFDLTSLSPGEIEGALEDPAELEEMVDDFTGDQTEDGDTSPEGGEGTRGGEQVPTIDDLMSGRGKQ